MSKLNNFDSINIVTKKKIIRRAPEQRPQKSSSKKLPSTTTSTAAKRRALRRAARRRRLQLAIRREVQRRLLLSREQSRGIASRTTSIAQRNTQTLAFIKKGFLNALWTAVVVMIVKLAPLLLLAIKLTFKSMVPLAGMSVFQERQEAFRGGFNLAPDPVQPSSIPKTNLQKNDADILDDDDELIDDEQNQDQPEDEVDLDDNRFLSGDDNDEGFF